MAKPEAKDLAFVFAVVFAVVLVFGVVVDFAWP